MTALAASVQTTTGATQLTSAHKAAMVLAALGPQASTLLVEDFSDDELAAFARAFCELKSAPPHVLEAVVREFAAEVRRVSGETLFGPAEARRVIAGLAGEDRAGRVLGGSQDDPSAAVFARLETIEPARIGSYLAERRGPFAAAVISRLSPETAAAVVAAGGAAFARRTVVDLAAGVTVDTAASAALAATIEAEFIAPLDAERRAKEPPPAVCDLVNALPSSLRGLLLKDLASTAPEMAKGLRAALLTFEDLPARAPAEAAPLIVKEVDRETLLVAVRYGQRNAPSTVDFLFGAISKRLVEQYQEELAAMLEPAEAAGEDAQRKVMAIVRRLAASGAFKIAPPPAAS